MSNELISVKDVAKNLAQNRQYIFKIMRRLDIKDEKIKSSASRGQKISFITNNDYERIKEYLESSVDNTDTTQVQSNGFGVFYLIQLEPEHDPGRFKLGYATSIEERLRSHKTAAPLSKVIKTWQCKLLWEKTAIDSISHGYERLYTEVFRTDSIDEVLERCEAFFKVMPTI
ncbi:MAG: hypothetical protein KAR83_03090 [Thermodesulfovibrionales bacterium]|nr:hypothetical protein [Thermodesulfovibrionales bacterium]